MICPFASSTARRCSFATSPYAHFGAPPQINMVRVDGENAVLMTILKKGSASTLDVIDDVKALLPKLRETVPASLKLVTINDQSSFVFSAVDSVIFEGVVAAALTGLMILIFLGSWRSTSSSRSRFRWRSSRLSQRCPPLARRSM